MQTKRQFIHAPVKFDRSRHNQFRGGAWCGRAQVRHEISNSVIDFVSDRGDNRNERCHDRTRNDFLVKLPQILNATAATSDYDQIEWRPNRAWVGKFINGRCNFRGRAATLHPNRIDQDFDPASTPPQNVENIANRSAAWRGDDSDPFWESREWFLARRIEQALGFQLALERLEFCLQ